jgi:Urocanase Rossmann-like domain
MTQNEQTFQERILRTFTTLLIIRQDWGGALILCCGLGPQGSALALASNIAGAVCLNIEEDPAALKEATRSGSCDFIVNTLDEALRAMKNEIRKHLPLSVGLQGDPTLVLAELLERGVSPQLFTDLSHDPNHARASDEFKSQGTLVLDFDADPRLKTFLHQQQWHLRDFTFATPTAQRAFDTRALSLVPEDDQLRRRWLQSVPRILQRERPIRRLLWLTEPEAQTLQIETQT